MPVSVRVRKPKGYDLMETLWRSRMLSHEELHTETLTAARNEKPATLILLKFLKEVEERRTFAVLGHPSLFKYVEEGLGYSGAQTSERISAMRLLKVVPEVASHLMKGTHFLTSIAKVASHARREGLNPAEASALIEETHGQSIMALENHLVGIAEVEPARIERAKVVSRELTRLTLDVDDEFMARVNRIRELKGNQALSLSEVFGTAMVHFIQKKDPAQKNPDGKDPVVRTAEVSSLPEVGSDESNLRLYSGTFAMNPNYGIDFVRLWVEARNESLV
jgi:hypothetical protein